MPVPDGKQCRNRNRPLPVSGYKTSARIAKTSLKTGKIVRELVLEENLIKADELDEILDAYAMTEPEVILIKEAM